LKDYSSHTKATPRVMVFNLAVGGHHDEHILHLIRYWCAQDLPGLPIVVVSPQFMEVNAGSIEKLKQYVPEKLLWSPITLVELQRFEKEKSLLRKSMVEWQLFCRYAQRLGVDHSLIMYLDSFIVPLTLRLAAPCDFSGIYFRPTLHYKDFACYHPSLKERIRDLRKTMMLSQWLRHPFLKRIFCLDIFAVKPLQKYSTHVNIIPLPEPMDFPLAGPLKINPQNTHDVAQLRQILQVEPQRKVFLLFGAISAAKGVFQLLEALRLLPSVVSSQLAILIVGKVVADLRDHLQEQINITREFSSAQIIWVNEFIPFHEMETYFDLADVVLIPYQRHIGSSGILVRAAAAGRPVLASDYGLVGKLVRGKGLGLTIDATQPSAIAAGLTTFLQKPAEALFDETAAREFAAENTAENFAHVLYQHSLSL